MLCAQGGLTKTHRFIFVKNQRSPQNCRRQNGSISRQVCIFHFSAKKEGNNLACVCVMRFFLLSGRIFLQSTGRCCIRDFVVFFSVVFIFGFVFSSPLDLVFISICLLSAALCLRHCLLGLVFAVSCLLSVYLRIVSCLSEPSRLLEVSRAVRLH